MKAQRDERYMRSLKRVSDTTRSWRSAEDGVNTLLECFECIVDALDELSSNEFDSNTTVLATNLMKRLGEFEVIVVMCTLQVLFLFNSIFLNLSFTVKCHCL